MREKGRKSVLLIGNFPPPFGGIPTHLAYLAPYIASKGWTVDVLSLKLSDRAVEEVSGARVHRPGPLNFFARLRLMTRHAGKIVLHFRCFLAAPREFRRYLQLYAIARQICRERSTAVVAAYHLFPSGIVGLWLQREFRIPLVTTLFGELYLDPEFHRKRLHDVQDILESSDALLSCSAHCAASPKVLGLPHRAEVVYYGIDVTLFTPATPGLVVRSRFAIPPDAFVVLYLARMEEEMGLGVLLAALPTILSARPGIRFLIAGKTGPLRKDADEASRLHPGLVAVWPDVPFSDLPAVYAAASLVVVPSVNQRACLGLAIAEAMAVGKPVVVSDAGGGPEVLADGQQGRLVPANDPKALAKTVLELEGAPQIRSEMGASGRERVQTLFDKDKTNQVMEALFLKAMR